ncbi:hypothetical protein NADFUDRAFT_48064 [Nadsonia fulvescens var. elongata DSM 6958]|uniref:Uncharacterized protein n=1 Tax=Nadsonia fulvescens var. elongata DSM 6958 TaxID=857566 RepID=A0A1E3PE99_9ASCO|nr:hypothetical protein NADFUDRAFT_48064 [Nadsonia fulvescens var. elongata DSM 6958]
MMTRTDPTLILMNLKSHPTVTIIDYSYSTSNTDAYGSKKSSYCSNDDNKKSSYGSGNNNNDLWLQ